MLIITSSPKAIAPGDVPDSGLVQVLKDSKAQGNPVGLISNHPQPAWFEGYFDGSGVQFLHTPGRQNGDIISLNADKFNLQSYDVIVLAATSDDVAMGKNGGAVLVGAGWSTNRKVQELGIGVCTAQEFQEVIDLTAQWPGQWWYAGDAPFYSVKSLSDLSGYGKTTTQQVFANKLTTTVKNGGARLNALLAVTARSLLKDGVANLGDLMWGVYPSSSSANDDQEVLSDFTHRLRTTVSRVRLAKRDKPLFIRHSASPKRSAGGGEDRTDPSNQVTTVHLNPEYRKNVVGRNVVVIDDCATYGVSFGVAAAFLKKAGAATVTGVALGKFGNCLGYYEIDINSDPFAPVTVGQFNVNKFTNFPGATNASAQNTLQTLIP